MLVAVFYYCVLYIVPFVLGQRSYTVSGLSSGAFFAVDYAVAHSSVVTGVGVVAGGPYYCAQDKYVDAVDACMELPSEINVNELVQKTKSFATSGYIDDTSHLATIRAYLYSGTADTVVNSGSVKKAAEYFSAFTTNASQVVFQNNVSSEHAMITNFYGNKCSKLGEPYINNCDYDLAGVILNFILNTRLNPPVDPDQVPYNNVITIDQSHYVPNGKTPSSISMENTAYIYVSSGCSINPLPSKCLLHVVFHGCDQYEQANYNGKPFNDTYVRNTGYNEWAESNNMVVFYPQASADELKGNPDGCWDWWGYDGSDYAFKSGQQIATVTNMVNYIIG